MTEQVVDDTLEDLEVEQLLDGLYRLHGHDFREYATGSLKRRIRERVRAEKARSVTGLQEKVLHDRAALDRLLLGLSVNVSAMFRDPTFFRAFREKVVPLLRTYPFIRVWHAGCSSGEEVYSLAILMQEEGLYDRCRFYATDMNEAVLQQARDGIYPLKAMKQYTSNYIQAGGRAAFSEYYTASHDHAILRPALRANVVFAQHNLATDGAFNEFQVVMCRNVMIYFKASLQERVHRLFLQSLVPLGFLALGSKESLSHSGVEDHYRPFDAVERIYRRAR
jgi:chemotaxis protein methyltransferase CheR